jgi:DNA replication protein DnaC
MENVFGMLEGTDLGNAMKKSNISFATFTCEKCGHAYKAMQVKFKDGTMHHAPCPRCEEKSRKEEEERIVQMEADPAVILRKKLVNAQVPTKYLDYRFGNFPMQKGTLEAYQGSQSFLSSKYLDLVLLGPTGLGKTSLAVSVIRHALQKGKTARFVKEASLLDEIKGSFSKRGESSEEIVDRYSRYDVLVIDEVGLAEWSDFDATKMTTLIDNRNSYLRKTVLMGNLTEAGYRAHFNDQCISRLHQDADFYILKGQDLRYSER